MGTRHLIAVQVDGEYKIAQYGQWDGYPGGQGAKVLAFLATADLEAFRDKLRLTQFATDEQIEDAWVAAGARPGSEFVTMDVSARLRELHPELSRDTGAEVLRIVLEAPDPTALRLVDSIAFAQDSLFCEYAYVIDLDAGQFEFYTGFNKDEVTEGRFAGPKESGLDNSYGPVKLRGTWPLDALPTVEDLQALCVDEEEEEEEEAA
jgi:hypothetical protein